MVKADEKMIRVELRFDGGLIRYVEGEEAQKWWEAVKGQAVFCSIHGWHFPELDWREKRDIGGKDLDPGW